MATRHNLNINPAAKNNITNWQQSGANAPTRVTGLSGASSGRTTGAKWTTGTFQTSAFGAASPSVQYTVSIDILTDTFNQSNRSIHINFSRSAGGDTQTLVSSTLALTAGTWSRISGTATAPANTTGVGILIDGINASLSPVTITAVLAEATGSAGTYFDGDTSGATWDGTDGNSASTLTSGGSVSADAALAVTATLSGAGAKAIAPAAALSVTATLTAAAVKAIGADAALAATATLSTVATKATTLSAALSVTATLTAAATKAIGADAALSVAAVLAGAGTGATTPAAALSATATLSASVTKAIGADAALSAVATLSGAGSTSGAPDADAALTVTAALSASGVDTISADTGLAVTATLSATAVTGTPPEDADADLAATATLTASAFLSRAAGGPLAGTALLLASAVVGRGVVAALQVTATLRASASLPAPPGPEPVGSWESLLGVLAAARGDAAADADREANPVDCPVHGWPLERARGKLFCLFGGHTV